MLHLVLIICCNLFSYRVRANNASAPALAPGVHIFFLLLAGPLFGPFVFAWDVIVTVANLNPNSCSTLTNTGHVIAYFAIRAVFLVFLSLVLRALVDLRLARYRSFVIYSVVCLVFSLLIGVEAGVGGYLAKSVPKPRLWDAMLNEGLQELSGFICVGIVLLVYTPWVCYLVRRGRLNLPTWGYTWRCTGKHLLAISLVALSFGYSVITPGRPRLYLFFISVSYAATQHGRLGGSLFALLVSLVVIVYYQIIYSGTGATFWTLGDLQIFGIVVSIQGMVLGISEDRDEEMVGELRRTSGKLERAVVDLAHASAEAQKLALVKEQFLDDISHEVRTPLHGMLGYLGMLMSSSLSEAQRRWVSTMQNSAALLVAIVDDLLDISKVASGRSLTVHPTDFLLHAALEETLALTAGMKRASGVEVMSVVDPDLAVSVRADRHNLQRALLNLLSNALKFTPRGSVILKAFMEESKVDEVTIRVRVEDSGVGIRPDDTRHLFKRFSQVGEGNEQVQKTNPLKGTGLGLAITKELVENTMKGKIGADSVYGYGTTFWFSARFPRSSSRSTATHPLARLTRSASTVAMLRSAPQCSVAVVVHSNAEIRKAFTEMLSTLGIAFEVCSTTDEAAEAVQRHAHRHRDTSAGGRSGTLATAVPLLSPPTAGPPVALSTPPGTPVAAGTTAPFQSLPPAIASAVDTASLRSPRMSGARMLDSVVPLDVARAPIARTSVDGSPPMSDPLPPMAGVEMTLSRHASAPLPARAYPSGPTVSSAQGTGRGTPGTPFGRDEDFPSGEYPPPADNVHGRGLLAQAARINALNNTFGAVHEGSHGELRVPGTSRKGPSPAPVAGPPPVLVFIDSSVDSAEIVLFGLRVRSLGGPKVSIALMLPATGSVDEVLQPGAGTVDTMAYKPVSCTTVARMLALLVSEKPFDTLSGNRSTASSPSQTAQDTFEGVRFLVADDNPVNRELASELLLTMGIREEDIVVAEDGDRAAKAYADSFTDPRGPVDVVLMDCAMPVLDGFGATRLIRSFEQSGVQPRKAERAVQRSSEESMDDEAGVLAMTRSVSTPAPGEGVRTARMDTVRAAAAVVRDHGDKRAARAPARRVWVIAVTAYAIESCRDRCVAAGMDDFLTKPFTEEQLRDCLLRWLQTRSKSGRE